MQVPLLVAGDLNFAGKSLVQPGSPYEVGNMYTATASGVLGPMLWMMTNSSANTQTFQAILYSFSAGNPVNRLGSGPAVSVPPGTAANTWVQFPWTSPAPRVQAGTQYLFGLQVNPTDPGAALYSDTSLSGATNWYAPDAANTPPSTWAAGGGTENSGWTFAVYLVADPQSANVVSVMRAAVY